MLKGWLVGWNITALSTQFRSYCAFKVITYFEKYDLTSVNFNIIVQKLVNRTYVKKPKYCISSYILKEEELLIYIQHVTFTCIHSYICFLVTESRIKPDGDFWRLFCILCFQRAACSRFQTCILNSH